MADVKFSALTAQTTLEDTNEFPLADSGASKKVTWANMKAQAGGGMLGLKVYAPSTQTIYSTTSATFADVDATNAAVTFTAPASGNVIVRVSAFMDSNNLGDGFIGLRESTTDISGVVTRTARANLQQYFSVPMYVSGISAGSHTYKLSFASQTGTGATFRIIIQDGTVATTKWGPLIIEVWPAP